MFIMEKNKSLTWYAALGVGVCYLGAVFASCFIGFLSPACWAFFSVLAALLAVGPYYWISARWQKFGVGTYCASLVCLFCLATGEASGLLSKIMILAGGVLADCIRLALGNDTKKALYAAYPLLAIGNIGWIINLWTRPDWYVEGAAEEMGQSYAGGIAALQHPGVLVICIVVTAVVAVAGIWLTGKVDKKSAKLLK